MLEIQGLKKMKIIGEVNISTPIIQVDKIADNFSLKAPKGSFLYSDPLNVLTKIGPKDTDWGRTTFRVMMMNILTWAVTLLDGDENDRAEVLNDVFKSIETFKKGETSKEGKDAVRFIKEECKIVGFIPQVTYIMPKERGDGSLECFWEHPFSIPTILAKHKTLPFLIISNGNIDFDDSRLRKMNDLKEIVIEKDYAVNNQEEKRPHGVLLNPKINDENIHDFDIELEEDDVQGITG